MEFSNWIFLLAFVFASIAMANSAPGNLQVFKQYKKMTQMHDILDNTEGLVAMGVTLLECAARCNEDNQCKSLFYGSTDQACYHRMNIYTTLPSYHVYASGYDYYYLVATAPPLPPATTNFPPSTNADSTTGQYDRPCNLSTAEYVPKLGKCLYILSVLVSNWEIAQAICIEVGGSLIELETAEKYSAVKEFLSNGTRYIWSYGFWVGAHAVTGHGYKWLSGEPVQSAFWATGEPALENERVAMQKDHPYALYTDYSMELKDMLCELESNTV